MAFNKKEWTDRQTEYPNRRRLSEVENQQGVFDVMREEGIILENGVPYNAETMNDLENRIESAIEDIIPMTISATGATSGVLPKLNMVQDGFELKDGAIIVAKLHIDIPSGTVVTLKINDIDEIVIVNLEGETILPPLITGTYITMIYSSDKNVYIAQVPGSVPKLTFERAIQTDLSSSASASFNGTSNVIPGVKNILGTGNGGTGNNQGIAPSATKLQTGRQFRVNVGSNGTGTFDGTANTDMGVFGTLSLTNGGTGRSDGISANNVLGGRFTDTVYALNANIGGTRLMNTEIQTKAGVTVATSAVVWRRKY